MAVEITNQLTSTEVGQLLHYEGIVERNIRAAELAGEALAEIYRLRLYRQGYDSFEAYLDLRWDFSRSRGYQLMKEAVAKGNVHRGTHGELEVSGRAARELAKLETPEAQVEVAREAAAQNGGVVTGPAVAAVIAQREETLGRDDESAIAFLADHRRRQGAAAPEPAPPTSPAPEADEPEKKRPNDEWYTIAAHAEAARRTLGGVIHFDPASCVQANRTIQALMFLTKDDDARTTTWPAVPNGYMNPPFTLVAPLVALVLQAYVSGLIPEWVVMTNANTETAWFEELMTHAKLMCLVKGRPKFVAGDPDRLAVDESGKRKSLTGWSGVVFFYLGENPDAFAREYARFGRILSCEPYVPEVQA